MITDGIAEAHTCHVIMGGARKFQLGGSRGAEGRARGQGHLNFLGVGVGTHADKRRMHAQLNQWNLHWTLPASEKKLAVSCKGSATFFHF